VASRSFQPFGHNRHGPKIGGVPSFWGGGVPPFGEGELGPHLAQCGLGRGLRPYQVACYPFSHLATTDMGRKWGAVPLWGRGTRSPSNTMWPGPRPTCVPSFILFRPTVWSQYTNVRDRQDRQTGRTDRQTDRQRTHDIGRTLPKNG